MAELVLPFGKISSNSVSIAGGKGAQLGEMFNAGIPVPKGFVVLTPSFEMFLKENNLKEKISAALGAASQSDAQSIEDASEKIRAMVEKGSFPKEVEKAALKEFESLKLRLVAVRSSATAEDSKQASWAGELETYTNVAKKELPAMVRKCWGSLFTSRAIFYRLEKKLGAEDVSVAVVVQQMVDSEAAGVCFTANPVTNDTGQIVIEAAYGLGESVVSGTVTPDRYTVKKSGMFIENIEVNAQEKMIAKVNGKTMEIAVKKHLQEKQKLEGKQILELAAICTKIESHYGFPQDIEFATGKGKIFILQTRPITTI
jgi:pyruvate,water dikinase